MFDDISFYSLYASLTKKLSSKIILLVIFTIAWTLLYAIINYAFKFKSLSEKNSNDVKNRMVSIVHGVITFWVSAYFFFPYPVFEQPISQCSKPNTRLQVFILLVSISYFIYDLFACIYYKLADFGIILHHLFCIFGFSSGAFGKYGAIYAIGGLYIAEVTNFCMHSRIILTIFNLKYTKTCEYCENFYLVMYIIFRGVICTMMVFIPCVFSPVAPWLIKVMGACLFVQNFYMITFMVQIIKKKLAKYKQMEEKSIEYRWFEQVQSQLEQLSFYKSIQQQGIF